MPPLAKGAARSAGGFLSGTVPISHVVRFSRKMVRKVWVNNQGGWEPARLQAAGQWNNLDSGQSGRELEGFCRMRAGRSPACS